MNLKALGIVLALTCGPPPGLGAGGLVEEEARCLATLRQAEAGPVRDDLSVAAAMGNLAGVYRRQRRFPEAEALLTRALAVHESRPGPADPDLGVTLLGLATLYGASGRLAEAVDPARRAAAVFESRLPPDAPERLACLTSLAYLSIELGQEAEAVAYCTRLVQDAERRHGPDSPEAARELNRLARAYQISGRDLDAEAPIARALQIHRRLRGPDHPDVVAGLGLLGHVCYTVGRYAEAESLLRQSLGIVERRVGPQHPDVLALLNEIAWVQKERGLYPESEALHRRARAAAEARWGPSSVELTTHLNGLAALDEATGRTAEAEELYRRVIRILDDRPGADEPRRALGLHRLAMLLASTGRDAEAAPLFRQGLEIRERRLGPDHPDVARSLDGLAGSETALGRYPEAEEHLRRAGEILRRRRGPDHPHVATNLIRRAALAQARDRFEEAESAFRSGLEIRERRLGPDHPDVAEAGSALAGLLAVRGDWDEALRQADRARRVIRRHTSRTLPELEEPEQLAFLKARDRPSFHLALSIALARPDDPRAVALSAAWVLNGKAVALAAFARRTLLRREATDAAREGLVRELEAIRQRIAAERRAAGGRGPGAGVELDRLLAEERAASKRLLPTGPDADLDADPWIRLEDVRARLPGDGVLVEIVRFEPVDFGARGPIRRTLPARYVAWVIPPAGRGEIGLVDLGPAVPLERAAAEAGAAILPSPQVLRRDGEPEAERLARVPLRALSGMVLDPLLPRIGPAKHWVISPDAATWLIPWSALVLPDGRYVVEDHRVTLVVSGRTLARPARGSTKAAPVVMADPDFDLTPADALAAASQLLKGTPAPGPTLLALRASARLPSPLQAVPRLPGTAQEAEAIRGPLARLSGTDPRLYRDRWALEPVFKALAGPPVLVLSTHGFTLDRPDPSPDGLAVAENPLLRCGLLLAGCNRKAASPGASPGGDDGILTGLEVVGADLRGTDLVVLSACQTALGELRDGEGVAGLRQAFQLAGARSVVATLWQVPDRDSAQLMAAFFDALARRAPTSEALRQAQLNRIRSRRGRFGAAHPFFWAAYTHTGPDPLDFAAPRNAGPVAGVGPPASPGRISAGATHDRGDEVR